MQEFVEVTKVDHCRFRLYQPAKLLQLLSPVEQLPIYIMFKGKTDQICEPPNSQSTPNTPNTTYRDTSKYNPVSQDTSQMS